MAGDGRILEAMTGKGYCRTSLSIHVEGAYAGSAMVPLHRIVAYTFLGKPPTPLHTVDHINRVREDNRVENLKWASPREQLANREFSRYMIRTVVQGGQEKVFDSLTAVSNDHGIGLASLSSLLRHAQPGDQFNVNGVQIHIERVVRKDVCASTTSNTDGTGAGSSRRRITTNQNYGGTSKPRESSRKHVALKMYIDGETVHQISTDMQIKTQTVYQYLGQAARESPPDVLIRLATRMKMTCRETRGRFDQDLANFHQHLQENTDYETQYQAIVAKHFPELHNDWPVVKETFRAIHKMLN